MVKEPKSKTYKVYEDMVTTVYENGKPVMEIRKYEGHDIFFQLKECHGGTARDLLQSMVMGAELLEANPPKE